MSDWIINLAYLAGIIATWRSFVMSVLAAMESDFGEVDGFERFMSLVAGTVMAALWPVMLLLRGGWRLVSRRGLLLTPNERAAADRAELEALRKLARDHGLPMPEEDQR